MKSILFLTIILTYTLGFSQNWEPFPYDSVFFEENTNHKALMPLIKTPNNNFSEVNTIPLLNDCIHNSEINSLKVDYSSWIGQGPITKINNKLLFISVFKDSIYIDLTLENNMDTLSFSTEFDSIFFEPNYHLKIIKTLGYDTLANDSLLNFSFNLLDSTFLDLDHLSSIYSSNSINNCELVLSKSKGIIKTPNWAFFPFNKTFNKRSGISEELDSFMFTDQIHMLNFGDEIHTQNNTELMCEHSKNIFQKKIVTSSTSDLNNIYNTYDVWQRIDSSTGLSIEVKTSFFTQTDTIQKHQALDKTPDGFNTNTQNNNGYFYRLSKYNNRPSLIYTHSEGPILLNKENDKITGLLILDMFLRYDYQYVFGLSDRFTKIYNQETPCKDYTFEPVYFNVDGDIWGVPFTDSFILETPEHEKETSLFIKNNVLFWKSEANIQTVRTYSSDGKLVQYYPNKKSKDNIDVSVLNSGIYFLVLETPTKSINLKFSR